MIQRPPLAGSSGDSKNENSNLFQEFTTPFPSYWLSDIPYVALSDKVIAYFQTQHGQIRIYDFETQKKFYLHHRNVSALVSNQQFFASISPVSIKIWDCATRKEIATKDFHFPFGVSDQSAISTIHAVIFENARFMAIGAMSIKKSSLFIVDLTTNLISSISLPEDAMLSDLTLAPDNCLVVSDANKGIYKIAVKFNIDAKESQWCQTKLFDTFLNRKAEWVLISPVNPALWLIGWKENLREFEYNASLYHVVPGKYTLSRNLTTKFLQKPIFLPNGLLIGHMRTGLNLCNLATKTETLFYNSPNRYLMLPEGQVFIISVNDSEKSILIDFKEVALYREQVKQFRHDLIERLKLLPFQPSLNSIVADYAYCYDVKQLLFAQRPIVASAVTDSNVMKLTK